VSFPRYPKYKPSGVEWLGEVPAHWEVTRLKGVCRLVTEKANSRNRAIALEHIESGTGRLIGGSGDFEGEGTAFAKGDLLFGKLRPYLAKAWVAEFNGEAVGDFHVMRPIRELSQRFLLYTTLNRDFIQLVDGSTYGSKMPRADWDFVGCMPTCVPSVGEQRAIAAFLDRETAKIDALIAEQEKLIALLAEKRQAVISHAVTKGLNPNAPMKPSGVEWLGEVPAHWEVRKMKCVAQMESGHTPDKKVPENWEDGSIPWVSLNDTGYLKDNEYITETAYQITERGIANSSARLLPPRAVVFSRDATIGRCAITTQPMAVSQHFIAWICKEQVIPEYLLQRLRSMAGELDRLTTGATLKTIGMPEVKTLVSPVPPVEEQKVIVAWISRETTALHRLTTEAELAITLLRERRAALISAAVTGQVDVRHRTPEAAA
jgi:type I restriction enzyme S subunit